MALFDEHRVLVAMLQCYHVNVPLGASNVNVSTNLRDYHSPSAKELLHYFTWVSNCIERNTEGKKTIVRMRSSGPGYDHAS